MTTETILTHSQLYDMVMENEAKTIYETRKRKGTLRDENFQGISYNGTAITCVISGATASVTYGDTGTTVSYTDPTPNEPLGPDPKLEGTRPAMPGEIPSTDNYTEI